jgi:tRNA (cmo5U34)-methyltransferase
MKNHFDAVASDWDKNQLHLKRTKAIAKCLSKMIDIQPDMFALEFGAGTGLLSFELKKKFSEITLMDSSEGMIDAASEKIRMSGDMHMFPLLFDLEKNDFTEKKFDLIFSQMAMHHVKDIDSILEKFYMMLYPGGKLAIADLYTEDGTFHDFEFDGHFGFNPLDLAAKATKKGFSLRSIRKCFTIDRELPDGDVKKFPIFLFVAEK